MQADGPLGSALRKFSYVSHAFTEVQRFNKDSPSGDYEAEQRA